MWIIGGRNSKDTSEIVDVNGSIYGPKLPWDMWDNCASQMNDTHGIITGGHYGNNAIKRTLIFRYNDLEMTEGPPMLTSKFNHACSRFQHPNGTNFVVVASAVYYGAYNMVEVLNVDSIDMDWFKGKIIKSI